MHAVKLTDIRSAHVTVPVTDLKMGMTIQVTEWETYRDSDTDELITEELTYQASVLTVSTSWNAPSEILVSFRDGPGAWLPKESRVPLVIGPRNEYGVF